MNFVGHIHIASRCLERSGSAKTLSDDEGSGNRRGTGPSFPSATDRYLFGTALPDFASIGRFQLRADPDDRAVAIGVEMHHATDTAFHASDWFVSHSRDVSAELRRRGLNRGAARAVGHVGVELLLDGRLLTDHPMLPNSARAALDLADHDGLGLDQLVADDDRTGWRRHLRRISSWDLPSDYHRPRAVAERLYRILQPRRRLAFDRDEIDVVAATLEHRQPALIAEIGVLVDELVENLVDNLDYTAQRRLRRLDSASASSSSS